ncbi:MAG: phosphatidylserine decarboxylase [Oscillospiraceae bacterium]|nr:phosphatidylserine decarboxylase [Oscillospiraceae bacterium]
MIFNRKTGELTEEKLYKERVMRFFYNTVPGGLLVFLLRLSFISKLYGVTQRGKRSKAKAEAFIKEHEIDMSNYDPHYTCFNEFFIRRRLNIELDPDPHHLIAPADSVLLAYTVTNGTLFTVKNKAYTLQQFLKDEKQAADYEGGSFLIFRLRVYDYHRFSFIDDGEVLSRKRIRGWLDTVNQNASGKFTLSSNVRDVTLLRTQNFGGVLMAEIGAMLVGKIVQTYAEPSFSRGDEKGYFEFGGSTVVLIFKKNMIQLDNDILRHSAEGIETKVTLGEKIGVKVCGDS